MPWHIVSAIILAVSLVKLLCYVMYVVQCSCIL